MGKYFGTDGIRGKNEKFSEEFTSKIAKSLANILNESNNNSKVIIAGDTRKSTEVIMNILIKVLSEAGIDVINAGIIPTPALSYLTDKYNCDNGIMITASHNPATDNGIKIVNNKGEKLTSDFIRQIEYYIDNESPIEVRRKGTIEEKHEEAIEYYIEHLESIIKNDFSNLRIGIDCANGSTGTVAEKIFKRMNANLTVIHNETSFGEKINENCGSTHLESIRDLVLKNNLDFGIAFDGDGDRVLLIDEKGNEVDGDFIVAIIADNLRKQNKLTNNSIAVSVMSNQGLINWAAENNIRMEITPVGDAYVYQAMKEKGISIGGEQSGHIIIGNEKTGDGILTALYITNILKETNKSLSEAASIITKYPQVTKNIEADDTDKDNIKNNDEIISIVNKWEQVLDTEGGRLLIRPSGTESCVRITLWGKDENQINKYVDEISQELTAKFKEVK